MKYLPGVGGGTQSGSSGGVTASRNRGGQYFRRRAIPSNTFSVVRQQVRSAFGSLSQDWRALTPSQQEAWRSFGQTIVVIDRLGQPVIPSGQQAYMQCNQRLKIYASTITDPPASMTVPPIDAAALTVGTVGPLVLDATIAPTGALPADTALLIRATPPLSPGISNARKWFRVLGTSFVPSIAGLVHLATAYTAVFGTPTLAGPQIFAEFSFLSLLNGQVSTPLLSSIVLS